MIDYLVNINSNSILHYVNRNYLICSKKNTLYESNDAGETWSKFVEIPIDINTSLKLNNRLSRRLFRTYVYHVILQDEYVTVFAFGKIFIYSLEDKRLISETPIIGSRPLVVGEYKGDVYYGEYTSNQERSLISVFKSSKDKLTFEKWYTFDNIRHIHSIQTDPYTNKLYVATGDDDDECFIGYFDNNTFIPVVEGSQQARAIQLLFEKDYIYYATDAPDDENFIYRIKREDNSIEKLQKVGGPVFYGFQQDNLLFYSTICEPSEINSEEFVELWASQNGADWKKILTLKKDRYHMKLFQYGQIMFPRGNGNSDFLFFTPFATELDQKIIKLPIDKIKEKLEK